MSQSDNIVFVTHDGCMEGRVPEAFQLWLGSYLGPEFPGKRIAADQVVEPGIVRMLAEGKAHPEAPENLLGWIEFKTVKISKDKHGSNILILSGHQDCAGNPVSEEEHKGHIKKSLDFVKSWGFARIIGLYFDNVNALNAEDVKVEVVFDTNPPARMQQAAA
jgi:hypothetical protein